MNRRKKALLLLVAGIAIMLVIKLWHHVPADTASSSINSAILNSPNSPLDSAATTKPTKSENNRGNLDRRAKPANSRSDFELLIPEEIQSVRSEIKSSLAALYAAEKSFHAEYHRYTTDLRGLGYMPEDKQRWSKLGFLNPYSPEKLVDAEDPRYLDTDAYIGDKTAGRANRFTYRQTSQDVSLDDLVNFCQYGCTASEQHFEIVAAAVLVEGNAPDVWIINDQKMIQHVQDGLVTKAEAQ